MINHIATRLPATILSAAVLLLSTFSCNKDEPDGGSSPTPVLTDMQVVQGASTEYLSYPAQSSYEEALRGDNLTLSTTVNVATGTSNAVARWYLIEDIGPDKEIFMEDVGAREGEADYTSSITLTEEQFTELFPSGKFKERHFYCKFAFRSSERDISSTVFTSDTMTISTGLPAELMVLRIDTVNG